MAFLIYYFLYFIDYLGVLIFLRLLTKIKSHIKIEFSVNLNLKRVKNMGRVIIASRSENLSSTIRTIVVRDGYEVAAVVTGQYDLMRQAKALSPNIIIIDGDLNLEISLVEMLLMEQQGVLLVGKSFQKSYYQQSPYLEFCEKPIQPSLLLMTLRLLTKYTKTVRQLESKISKLEQRQKTDKLIQEAKRALQQYENMSEDEAHRYIQRRSMELRVSKLEFANRIIKRFEKKA